MDFFYLLLLLLLLHTTIFCFVLGTENAVGRGSFAVMQSCLSQTDKVLTLLSERGGGSDQFHNIWGDFGRCVEILER